MAIRTFHIDIEIEHGQLHEHLRDEADRLLMIQRLDDILSNPAADPDLRNGIIQVVIDQLTNNDGHEPIILRTGTIPGDDEEQLEWHCAHDDIEVDIDKFRATPRTPHKPMPAGNPFKFTGGNKAKDVKSTDYKNKTHSQDQKFYKFSIKGKDLLGNDLELDPCIICER